MLVCRFLLTVDKLHPHFISIQFAEPLIIQGFSALRVIFSYLSSR